MTKASKQHKANGFYRITSKQNTEPVYTGSVNLFNAKSKELTTLTEGWHYGEGIPVSLATIRVAGPYFLNVISKFPDTKFNLFPGIDGELNLSFYHKDYVFEFVFLHSSDTVSLAIEKGIGHHFNTLREMTPISPSDAIKIMSSFLLPDLILWNSSEYSTLNITTIPSADSKAFASEIQETKAAFLYSTKNVLSKRVGRYARTLNTTTTNSRASHLSSGLLQRKKSTMQRYYLIH